MKRTLCLAVAAIAAIALLGVSAVHMVSTPDYGRVVDIDMPDGG
jgi:hypothetical protein